MPNYKDAAERWQRFNNLTFDQCVHILATYERGDLPGLRTLRRDWRLPSDGINSLITGHPNMVHAAKFDEMLARAKKIVRQEKIVRFQSVERGK